MSLKKETINTDITALEKDGKLEFAQVINQNKHKTTKALNHFFTGVKNEAADTREATRIIVKFIVHQKITKKEEKQLKLQVQDIFKILGIGIPFMLIPGATILIPVILKIAKKKGLDLFPSNFKSPAPSSSNKQPDS